MPAVVPAKPLSPGRPTSSVLLTVIATLGLATATYAQQTTPQTKESFDSTYGAVTERNPFLRERHKPKPPDTGARRPNPGSGYARPRTFVLRGIAIEDAQLHAYLESSRGGDIVRVAPGDTLGDGKVVDIALDAIAYDLNGRVQWVEIGQDLTGTRGTAIASAQPTVDASTQPGGATPAPLPPGGGTFEERMKARRAQMRGNK